LQPKFGLLLHLLYGPLRTPVRSIFQREKNLSLAAQYTAKSMFIALMLNLESVKWHTNTVAAKSIRTLAVSPSDSSIKDPFLPSHNSAKKRFQDVKKISD
jgi:hypothetical protein